MPVSVKEAMEKQVSAERERRATIAESEGVKQSRINKSEGIKMELINKSEGEKTRQVNEAEGRATAIESIAEATASSIEQIGAQISSANGLEAVKLIVSQKYLTQLGKLASENTDIIIPADITHLNELLNNISLKSE